jgi:hypothetical protein
MLVAKVHAKELTVTGHDAVLVEAGIVQMNDILILGRNAPSVKEILEPYIVIRMDAPAKPSECVTSDGITTPKTAQYM